MVTQLNRLAPLTGVVYALLTLVAFGTASEHALQQCERSEVIWFYERAIALTHGSRT